MTGTNFFANFGKNGIVPPFTFQVARHYEGNLHSGTAVSSYHEGLVRRYTSKEASLSL